MKKYYKKFENKTDFYTALASLSEGLDLEAMLESIPKSPLKVFWYCPVGKPHVRCANIKVLLGIISRNHKLPFLWPICLTQGSLLNVYTKEDIFNTEKPTIIPPVVNSIARYVNGTEEKVIIDETVAEEKVEAEWVLVFDKTYADSLYDGSNVKASKNALEDYGSQFGIDLKKNKSFANMLSDLVAHVEAQ